MKKAHSPVTDPAPALGSPQISTPHHLGFPELGQGSSSFNVPPTHPVPVTPHMSPAHPFTEHSALGPGTPEGSQVQAPPPAPPIGSSHFLSHEATSA